MARAYDGGYRPVLTHDPTQQLSFDNPYGLKDLADQARDAIENLLKLVWGTLAEALELPGKALQDIVAFLNSIVPDLSGLLDALRGNYAGTDRVLQAIQAVARGFQNLLPTSIPIGLLDRSTPNLLLNGGFNGAESMIPGEGWSWDEAIGRTTPGSARFDATGQRGVQLSNPVLAEAGQKLEAEAWVRWTGVAAAASFGVMWRWYAGNTLVSEKPVKLLTQQNPGGGWTKLSATAAVPESADSVCLALVVEDSTTTGSVWFDDAAVRKPSTSLPQQFVEGLDEALAEARRFIDAIIKVFQGNTKPLEDLLGEAIEGIKADFEELLSALRGQYDGDDAVLKAIQTLFAPLRALPQLVADLIDGIISVIRGVPLVGGSLANLLDELTKWRKDTNGTKAAVIAGSKQAALSAVDEAEPGDVRDAVAALASRNQDTATNRELEYLFAMPTWAGLLPGGVVTTPISSCTTDVTFNDVQFNVPGCGALFRPAHTEPLRYATFCIRRVSPVEAGEDTRVYLMSWRPDINRWVVVAVSNNLSSAISDTWGWVDAQFAQPYSPRIGETMCIMWDSRYATMLVAGSKIGAALPGYRNSLGGGGTYFTEIYDLPAGTAAIGAQVVPPGAANWWPNRIPFAHIAPDIGQGNYVAPPLNWFDDMSFSKSRYYIKSTTRAEPLIDGKLHYGGSTDGRQHIIPRASASTDRIMVAATLSGATNVRAWLSLGGDSGAAGGVALGINASSARLYTVDSLDWTSVTNVAEWGGGNGRWQIDCNPANGVYTIRKDGAVVGTWSGGSVLRGASRRYCGAGVERALFINSGQWDDLEFGDVENA